MTNPRFCAALMGTLVKGLGYDHVFWGSDSVWYGSPQWQIEALRRLEIPEDMQKKHGFAALGPADGAIKSAIFGYNAARFYKLDLHAELPLIEQDPFSQIRYAALEQPSTRSNATYGYIPRRGRSVPAGVAARGPSIFLRRGVAAALCVLRQARYARRLRDEDEGRAASVGNADAIFKLSSF